MITRRPQLTILDRLRISMAIQDVTDIGVVAKQHRFPNLAAFTTGQENFRLHFSLDGLSGVLYRGRPHFIRFQKGYPDLEAETTQQTIEAMRRYKQTETLKDRDPKILYEQFLPNELLFEAYKRMSDLVFLDDPQVRVNSHHNDRFLLQ